MRATPFPAPRAGLDTVSNQLVVSALEPRLKEPNKSQLHPTCRIRNLSLMSEAPCTKALAVPRYNICCNVSYPYDTGHIYVRCQQRSSAFVVAAHQITQGGNIYSSRQPLSLQGPVSFTFVFHTIDDRSVAVWEGYVDMSSTPIVKTDDIRTTQSLFG